MRSVLKMFVLIAVFLMLSQLSVAMAGADFENSEITLKPEKYQIVLFNNNTDETISLEVVNLTAPPQLLSYVVVYPLEISPQSSENVRIAFSYISPVIRENLPSGTFVVAIYNLTCSLDLTSLSDGGEDEDNLAENIIDLLEEIQFLKGEIENLKSDVLLLRALKGLIDNIHNDLIAGEIDRDNIWSALIMIKTLAESADIKVDLIAQYLDNESGGSSGDGSGGFDVLFLVLGAFLVLLIAIAVLFRYKLKGQSPAPPADKEKKSKLDAYVAKLEASGRLVKEGKALPLGRIDQLCETCRGKVVDNKIKFEELCDKCRRIVREWK